MKEHASGKHLIPPAMRHQVISRHWLWILVAILTGLSFALRLFRYDAFPLYGDEWNSLKSATHLGNSAFQFFYALQLRLVLDWLGLSEFSGRLLAMIYGAASVPLMYLLGRRIQGTCAGVLSALLFALSSFNIAQSQEVRYYSQFGFYALLSLYLLYRYLDKPSTERVMAWAGSSGLMVMTTTNGLFPLLGSCALIMWAKMQGGARRRLYLLLSLAALGLSLFILQFRASIFLTLQRFGGASELSDPTFMRGWSIATFLKFPFAVLNFALGPNVNPLEHWWFVSVTLLLLGGLFLWGLYRCQAAFKYHLVLSFLLIPMVLQIGVAEPFSTYQYATIEPKHVMYAFPIWLLFVSIGLLSIPTKAISVLLGVIVAVTQTTALYMYYFPSFSYYEGRYADIRLAGSLIQQVALLETLFVVDGPAKEPFEYYFGKYLEGYRVVSPYEVANMQAEELKSYRHIFLILNDWKACPDIGASGYYDRQLAMDDLFANLNRWFIVADGYVRYPLFVYLLERDGIAGSFIRAPISCYGYYYKDLPLPFAFEGEPVLSSFGVGRENSPWRVELLEPKLTRSVSVLFNLQNTSDISMGEVVGAIKLTFSSGVIVEHQLIYGKNAADSFADYLGIGLNNPAVSIAKTWRKQPLFSTSFRYPRSYANFDAHIYALTIAIDIVEDSLERIDVAYFAKQGQIRLWGILLKQ